ncbi:hypothetical protein LguiA_015364 [Lonicera macranthoides]
MCLFLKAILVCLFVNQKEIVGFILKELLGFENYIIFGNICKIYFAGDKFSLMCCKTLSVKRICKINLLKITIVILN